jgi:hypothetical protein
MSRVLVVLLWLATLALGCYLAATHAWHGLFVAG